MSARQKESAPKKKGFLEFFSILLEMAIALGAATWFIYAYLPEYYLPLSFLLLALAGVFAYVILSKVVKF
ncbi:MAG: hypothetical protein ACRECH_02795 [Nitrososphaerales archaeon]